MTDRHAGDGVHLLTYVDRLAGDLAGLRALIDGPLRRFAGVHLLPFFVPFDGADAGFDPVDHLRVDPRLGEWADVRALAGDGLALTADLIVNHVSAQSAEFADWLAHGDASPSADMFLTFDKVFPDGADEAAITAIYRPREGLPFTPYQFADGTRRLVWTTFMPGQIDLDVSSAPAWAYLRRVLAAFAAAGVRIVRLDAIGYAVKTAGTDSFLTEDTLAFTERITAMAHEFGLAVLVEVHAHYTQQQAIAELVDYVYDFAFPPLLLHAFGTGDVARLLHWLDIRPANAVTVLDTHDGIGVIDAGDSGARPGLLTSDEMAAIFDRAAEVTNGESARASRRPAWTRLPHQINSTFFAVLGGDPANLVLARAMQLFLPGLPQLYYVGLLGGGNDMALFAASGEGRDVNRHHYGPDEVSVALATDVARAQLALVAIRTGHPAFGGAFGYEAVGASGIQLSWTNGVHRAELRADFGAAVRPTWQLSLTDGTGTSHSATTPAAVSTLETVL